MFNITTTVQIALAAIASVWIWRRTRLYYRRRNLKLMHGCMDVPEIPDWDPILGLGFTYKFVTSDINQQRLIHNVTQQLQTYGYTHASKVMGHRLFFTCEPDNLKAVLQGQFDHFDNELRSVPAGHFMGKGIFLADGEKWQRSRALVRPNFARDQVADLGSLERHFQILLSILPQDGSAVDLSPLFFAFTMDSITDFLFGESVKALQAHASAGRAGPGGGGGGEGGGGVDANSPWDQEGIEKFAEAWEYAQNDMLFRFVLGPARHVYQDKKANRCVKMIHDHVDRYVDEAIRFRNEELARVGGEKRTGSDGRYIFLYALAEQTQDRRVLRDELMNVLMAGRDTTAALLSNLFHTFARRPDVWAKVKNEVLHLEGRLPKYDDIRNMTYLRWCINESLRLHSVVGVLGKQASFDTTLPRGGGPGGKSPIFVPKGSVVMYSMLAQHRRKDLFGEDALEFRPERWETLRPGWNYVPFNGGPRICVGQQYALTEASYLVVRFAQTFAAVESRDPEPWSIGKRLLTCPMNGTVVSLRR
ncbi:hypothetical protein PpBr36_00624 [Pyricularia pennisetigena]|uniref:hypothetical protein n=1 Tax=Pyricularia pennisetigena TaxID=1578925 RepID=UPI00115084CD|nr:hypothetical protein PpBr36_00624 [Pyricularia pennisetigena]TLS29736.1 hypothetical protein PpBr36_00624 [Pyricularia pennisetigena]